MRLRQHGLHVYHHHQNILSILTAAGHSMCVDIQIKWYSSMKQSNRNLRAHVQRFKTVDHHQVLSKPTIAV